MFWRKKVCIQLDLQGKYVFNLIYKESICLDKQEKREFTLIYKGSIYLPGYAEVSINFGI